MSSARVTSLDALRHLRAALLNFVDESSETMVGLDMELRRGLQWLLDTQPKFWKNEERRLHDRVLEARQELSRCKSMALPGEVAPCSEQKHALERVIRQLRHAEEKSKVTQHWGRVIEHEAQEWQGRANQFSSKLEADLPKAIALLDRAIAALEGYLEVTAGVGSGVRASGSRTNSEEASTLRSSADNWEGTEASSESTTVPPADGPTLPSPEPPPFPEAADASR